MLLSVELLNRRTKEFRWVNYNNEANNYINKIEKLISLMKESSEDYISILIILKEKTIYSCQSEFANTLRKIMRGEIK